MSPEMHPNSFGTFEERAPGQDIIREAVYESKAV